jgi:hypothetical protein
MGDFGVGKHVILGNKIKSRKELSKQYEKSIRHREQKFVRSPYRYTQDYKNFVMWMKNIQSNCTELGHVTDDKDIPPSKLRCKTSCLISV